MFPAVPNPDQEALPRANELARLLNLLRVPAAPTMPLFSEQGRTRGLQRSFRQSQEIARDTRNWDEIAHAELQMGLHNYQWGDFDGAVAHFREAQGRSRLASHEHTIFFSLLAQFGEGCACHQLYDYEKALGLYRQTRSQLERQQRLLQPRDYSPEHDLRRRFLEALRLLLNAATEALDHTMQQRVTAAIAEPPPPRAPGCITLQETGMYKLTYSELANAGLSGSLTSSTIRMCSEDQEISIRVIDGGDGSFGSGDYVLFHGEALKTQETTTNVYWFTSGGSNGLRMASNNEAANTNTPSDYAKTLHLEEDHVYRSETPMNDNNDHWYWALLTYNPTAGLDAPFTVNNRIGTGYMVNVQVEVYGRRTSTGVPTDYRFEVKLNNQSVGIGQFTGSNNTRYLFSGDIDASALQEGSNLITIQPLDVNGSYYFFALNWIEVNVRRQFVAQNNRLAFTQDTAGDWKFQASGFNGSADVYNVTDPKNPVRMTNAAGSGTVTFSQDLSAPAGYEMVTASAYRSAQSIVKDTPSNWRSPNTADYIIITDPSLDSTALSSLRQKRTNQGLIVKTVYVQDIFDEFGYGIYSTQAIADFLAYAYEFWDNNGQSPPPTYALLVGEGSYDHRNILGENGPGDNLVPVYLLSGIDSNIGETTADNRYVAFGSDALAQMDLGRLPVKNTTELTTVVNKILAYENAPYDPRRASTHFFVADNAHNPSDCYLDPAGDFFANVNNFIGDFIGPNGQILKRVYYAPLSCYPNSDYPVYEPYYAGTTIDIQQRVISQYNAGPQFIVYTGHSGTLQWGKDSERFLTTTSIQTLANGDRTTIMLPMTCLEGLYHFPADEDAGLSESLLRLTTGGAVASFAPTGLQVQTAHNLLLDGFYMGLYEQGATTLGQAVMEAKVNLKLNGGSQYQDLQDTFMLLGDPAMQVKTWHSSYQVSVPAIVKP